MAGPELKTLYLCGPLEPELARLALTVNEAEGRWASLAILCEDSAGHGRELLGIPVLGPLARLAGLDPGAVEVQCLETRGARERWLARAALAERGLPFATLIHPNVDRRGCEYARDVVVFQNATLAPETQVAPGCLVGPGAVVGHESQLQRGCFVGAGAVLNARVVMEDGSSLGMNAVVIPEQRVGAWARVSSGSVVVQEVPAGGRAVGVPAQVTRCEPLPAWYRVPIGAGAER